MNIQDWSPSGWTGWISLQSKGLSRVFSNTTIQKHQFFSAQPSLWSNSHIYTWLLEKPQLWLDRPLLARFQTGKGPWGHSVSWEGTWVWTDSGRWWRTGKPGALQSMGSQRVKRDLTTEQQQANRIFHVPDSCEEQTTTSKCCGFC